MSTLLGFSTAREVHALHQLLLVSLEGSFSMLQHDLNTISLPLA